MPRPDHQRIRELEWELRDLLGEPEQGPPPRGTQSAANATSVLKESWATTVSSESLTLVAVLRQVWTDDLASDVTGEPGTHICEYTHSGGFSPSFAIYTEGFEHVTYVHWEPQALLATDTNALCVGLNRQFQAALQEHRDAIRKERLATAAQRVDAAHGKAA